jgi:photosystem II stability/assembly factor-like uncharacterized protein
LNEFLTSVSVISTSVAWVCSANGRIAKTTNGGTTWVEQTSGTTRALYSIHFADSNNGWAVGDYGTIIRTSDGGSTWSAQTSGTAWPLRGMRFLSSSTGFAFGDSGKILKTTNGGTTWTTQTSGTPENLTQGFFLDSSTGWLATSSGKLLKTYNGTSWNNIPLPSPISSGPIWFFDANNGVMSSARASYTTSDGGQTWTHSSRVFTNIGFTGMHFISSSVGILVGSYGSIMKTITGG